MSSKSTQTVNTADSPKNTEERAGQVMIPEFETSLKEKAVSFGQVAEAYFNSKERFNKDAADRLVHQRYHQLLHEEFVGTHGSIRTVYYCKYVVGAAVLTENDEIEIIASMGDPESTDVYLLLTETEVLAIGARRLLSGEERHYCIEKIYGIVTHILKQLDERKRPGVEEAASSILQVIREQLGEAVQYFREAAMRNAQLHYFFGMVGGFIILSIVEIIVALLPGTSVALDSGYAPLFGSFLAGGVGAVVSVMSRMTSGRMELHYEAGKHLLRLMGGFRPIVGSVLGAAIYILLAGGLLPISGPSDPTQGLYFYSGIGFVAGFSERWAQDMLVATKGRIGGGLARQEGPPVARAETSKSN